MTEGMPAPEENENDRPDPVHEEAERIAVPEFDFIGEPIGAIIDAVTGHAPDHRPETDEEGEATD